MQCIPVVMVSVMLCMVVVMCFAMGSFGEKGVDACVIRLASVRGPCDNGTLLSCLFA